MTGPFFDFDGNSVSATEWEKLRLTDEFQIGLDSVSDSEGQHFGSVSTVWVGICTDGSNPPLLFESMLTTEMGSAQIFRYVTRDDARAGHDRIVRELRRSARQ